MTDAVTNPINYLKARITMLAEHRKTVDEQRDRCALLDSQIKETSLYREYAEAKILLASMNTKAGEIDTVIRDAALSSFDGENKKPVDGIQITDTITVELINDKLIVYWAWEHNKKSLTYDKASIKKIAKVMDVDGTEVVKGHGVRIASDLSAYLE